jgi:hypothetical protein
MHKKIILLIPYFGKFPEWSDLFFETLKANATIDFYFFTDCEIEKYQSENIKYQKISFEDYIALVNKKGHVKFKPQNAYKICDLRPLFGYIHEDIFKDYDFYGWTDMDILFGDIRTFYTDEILSTYDVLSTHSIRLSGHLSLFKNNLKNRMMFRKIYKWEEALLKNEFVGIDEHGLTNAYLLTFFDKLNQKFKLNIENVLSRYFAKLKRKKIFFKEQYTTPFTQIPWIDGSLNSNQPDTWYYINGEVTNNRDGSRTFIYLHFMNFKNSLWRHDGTKAPWEGLSKIYFVDNSDFENGIVINSKGIYSL